MRLRLGLEPLFFSEVLEARIETNRIRHIRHCLTEKLLENNEPHPSLSILNESGSSHENFFARGCTMYLFHFLRIRDLEQAGI